VPESKQIEKYVPNCITNKKIEESELQNDVVSEYNTFGRLVQFCSCKNVFKIFVTHNSTVEKDAFNQVRITHGYMFTKQTVVYVDTLTIVRREFPQHGLGFVYNSLFNQSLPNAYRAIGDVEGMIAVLNHSSALDQLSLHNLILQYASNVNPELYIFEYMQYIAPLCIESHYFRRKRIR